MEKMCENCKHNGKEDCTNIYMCKNLDEWEPKEKNKERGPKNNLKENKHKMSEIPLDLLADLLCPAYKVGCEKYYRYSWRKGFLYSDMFDAAQRHMEKFFYENKDIDEDSLKEFGIEVHHLGAAIFSLIALYNSHINFPENDDRPNKKETK